MKNVATERNLLATSKNKRRNETLFAALVIVAMLLVVYRDVVFGGKTFLIEGSSESTMPAPALGPYGYDGTRNSRLWDEQAPSLTGEPFDQFIMQSYQRGDLPIWNPHQGLGIPLVANGLSGMFDPIKLIVFMAPPSAFAAAEDLQLLFRYFLAGLFTYLLARALGANFASGLGASAIYMFGSYFMESANIAFVHLDLLLPLVMYAYYLLAARRSWQTFALTALAIFLLVISDFPEALALYIGVGLLWYATSVVAIWRHAAQPRRVFVGMIIQGVGATGIGILMGAFTLLPFVQYLSAASHVHDPGLMTLVGLGAWPIKVLGGFLIPSAYYHLGWMYFGVLVIILWGLLLITANYRVLIKRRRSLLLYTACFVSVIIVMIAVMFRIPPLNWVADLPILNMTYLNRHLQPIILLMVAGLGAIALEMIQMRDLRRRLLTAFIGAGLLLGAYSLTTVFDQAVFLPVYVNLIPVITVFFTAIFLFIAWLSSRLYINPPVIIALLIGSLLVEVMMYDSGPRPSRYDPYTVPPFVAYLQKQPTADRILGLNAILAPNVATAYGLDDIRYNDALNPKRFFEYSQALLFASSSAPESPSDALMRSSRFDGYNTLPRFDRALDLLNATYILTTTESQPPQTEYSPSKPFELVHQSVGVSIYRNPNALPRAFIVHTAEVIPTLEATLTRLGAPGFDPAQTVLLQQPVDPAFMQSLPTGSVAQNMSPTDSAQVMAQSNNAMTVQTTLGQPGFLVVSELDYPGWEAVVDGQPTSILTAYGIIRAVPLAGGTHTVEFRYRPASLFVGAGISGAALAFLALLSLSRAWRRRSIKA